MSHKKSKHLEDATWPEQAAAPVGDVVAPEDVRDDHATADIGATDAAVEAEFDRAGLELASQIDELIQTANSARQPKANAPALEADDIFASVAAVIEEDDQIASDSLDATGENPSAIDQEKNVSIVGDDEQNSALDEDESFDMQGSFATLEEVMEEAEADELDTADAEAIGAEVISADTGDAASSLPFENDDDANAFDASFETVDEVTGAGPVFEPDIEPDTETDTYPVMKSERVAEVAAAEDGPGFPIDQIDELLAEQADTAVAGDFETPGEILAAEQVDDANPDAASLHDGFASPDDVFAEDEVEVRPMPIDSGTIMEAPLLRIATPEPVDDEAMSATDSIDEEPYDAVEAAFEPAVEVDLSAEAEAGVKREPSGLFGRIVTVCSDNVYRFCELTNRPLQNMSESSRRLVGMIALVTVANATIIMLGKIVFSLLG